MPTLSIEKSRTLESAAPKKGSAKSSARATQGDVRYGYRQETAAVWCIEDRASRRREDASEGW
jgi:hypothetical protein